MKGIVFTEFLEMVEAKFSPDVADEIIETTELPSGGAYSAVGTYDHGEMVALVTRLAELRETTVPDLMKAFGAHLFSRFTEGYPQFFEGKSTTFDFLAGVEGYIHVEVRKLYPDAELPTFETSLDGDVLTMTYRSPRRLGDLAEGLIEGCGAHFGESLTIEREEVSGDGQEVKFVIRVSGRA